MPASLGRCQTPLDSLLAFAGRKGSKSLLILKDGRKVVEQYYGTYTADSTWYWASAAKSLTATLVGLARFGLFILARGSWNGTPILANATYFQAMATPSQTLNRSYGYLWWLNGQASYKLPGSQITLPGPLIPSAPADLIAALGKNDQKIYVVPSLGLVVVRQGQSAGASRLAASSFDSELWTKIMAVLCRPTPSTVAAEAAGFLAFPNPATEIITLRQSVQSTTTVRLLDALGREVLRQPTAGPETLVSVAALVPGLYTAQWLDAGGRTLMSRKVARD